MKLTKEIELSEAEVKQALLDFVNERTNTSKKDTKFSKIGKLNFLNGTHESQVLFTEVKFEIT